MTYERIHGTLSEPIPITWINVFNPSDDSKVERVKVIVDTGAGVTCLPQDVIEKLGDLFYTEVDVTSPIDSDKRKLKLCVVSLRLPAQSEPFRDIKVLEIPSNYGIIGRDILNQYRIVLDAPSEQWGFKCRWIDGETCDGENCILPISSQNL
jgi:hypothetical protein